MPESQPPNAFFLEAVGILGTAQSAFRLKISERTLRRLIAGDSRLHDGFLTDMAAIMAEQAKLCLYLSQCLKQEAGTDG